MHFCPECSNMYYLKLGGSDPAQADGLIYYCRHCGHEDSTLASTSVCVSHTTLKSTTQKYAHSVNEYTKEDPTLPRTSTIRCPNQDCKTNTGDAAKEVIYLRYDDANMAYLYICTACNTTWKTQERS